MSLKVQFYSMIAMVGMGAYLGMALDTYHRFLNRKSNKNKLLVYLTDILFWIFQGLLIFYVLYSVNEGELRFYILLAILCGFAAYQSLFQKMYKRLLEFFIQLILRTTRVIIKIVQAVIIRPVRWIIKVIIALILFIFHAFVRLIRVLYNVLLAILQFFARILWFFVPKRVKNILFQLKGIYEKKKNTFLTTIRKVKHLIDRRKK
jgi:spore cortex biosynthesis protein YabQ